MEKFKSHVFTWVFFAFFLIAAFPNTLKATQSNSFTLETAKRVATLKKDFPDTKFATYECTKAYDTDRIQGLLLFLYMNKIFDENGRKITIANPACDTTLHTTLLDELIDLNASSDSLLLKNGLRPITPQTVYRGTARWWFQLQP